MKIIIKVVVGICIYLTSISLISVFTFPQSDRNEIFKFLSPYPLQVGHITGDMFAIFSGLIIMIVGIVGLTIFYLTKAKKTWGLRTLLIFTFFFCIIQISLIKISPMNVKLVDFIPTVTWSVICIIGIITLWKGKGLKVHRNK